MDPYLERYWRDVHTALIAYSRDDLNQRLPDDLIARAEERMEVEAEAGEADEQGYRRPMAPDVGVFGSAEEFPDWAASGGAVALAPFRLELLQEPLVERFIQIIDSRGGEKLITVVEFISPTNKSEGLADFVKKREELLTGGVSVVEIDLVREGNWRRLLARPCPPDAVATYRATLRLPGNPQDVYLHPFSLREPMPTIKIPLRRGEAPAELPLQPLIDQAYRNGRYARALDYRRPCDPPLEGEEETWADGLLRAAEKR